MFGLALGVGMLVDNSVVVFENILRKSEEGLDRFNAALKGSTEMNKVIAASTLTTIIVFLPMVFVKSEMSLLYGGVAWTITFSLCVSLFVALALVPLMASKIKVGTGLHAESILSPLYKHQKKMLFWVMRRRGIVISAIILFFLATLFMYTKIGKEFIGTTEQNKFTVFVELPTGAKLDVSDKVVKRIEGLLRDIPEVKTFQSRVEAWSSKIYVELVRLRQRKRSVSEVIESLRPKTDRIKPAFIYYEEEREVGTKEIILDLFGYDYDILRELAISMATRMNNIKGFTDTKIRMREGRPELGLKVDKQKAGLYDLSTRDIADSVHAQMRGLRATLFHTKSREIETIARLDEKYRKTFKDVHKLVLIKEDGTRVFLDQVVDFKYGLGPSEI
ncbi:MAG: efflux RND transporter permease subunit, partial [Candidatus Omnitrophica bacterium]|nr:efflux RND transporter permease subunit [Candidatus Omnitrophota bacterium]